MISLSEYDEIWLRYMDEAKIVIDNFEGKSSTKQNKEAIHNILGTLHRKYETMVCMPLPYIRINWIKDYLSNTYSSFSLVVTE
jgi:hypothetical protein